jgi:hypothetical protein
MSDRAITQYHDILRHDFSAFVMRSFLELNPATKFLWPPYFELLVDSLERVRKGEITRKIVNMPPRSLKSHIVSVAFPAWLLGHNPSAQIIVVSYGQELADKFARDCKSLMTSRFYETVFPTRLSQKQAAAEFETTAVGCRLATSVGGVLTGRGADFIIIDDPLKPDEAVSDVARAAANDWYNNTLYSRLNDKTTGAKNPGRCSPSPPSPSKTRPSRSKHHTAATTTPANAARRSTPSANRSRRSSASARRSGSTISRDNTNNPPPPSAAV